MAKFEQGDKVIRTGWPHSQLVPVRVYTVTDGDVETGSTREWITLEGVPSSTKPWVFLASEFDLAMADEPKRLSKTDAKPGDTVTVRARLHADSNGFPVFYSHQLAHDSFELLAIGKPKPVPPTTPGSHVS